MQRTGYQEEEGEGSRLGYQLLGQNICEFGPVVLNNPLVRFGSYDDFRVL